MVFPVVGGDGKPTGYEVENSLRFNNPDDPNLSTTFSSAGNRRTFTISAWIKKGDTSADRTLIGQGGTSTGNPRGLIFVGSTLRFTSNTTGSSTEADVETNAKLRDHSAWYHVVVAVDTTQGTAANRIKLYINGEQQTSLSSTTYPNQNFEMNWNNNVLHTVGRYPNNDAYHMDGYISEFYFIDGTQYAASNFGETDDNGVWIPKDASGDLTFGTNGFYLEFKQTGTGTNSSGMGADTSGNDNHLAVNNLAAIDVTTDTPTNNFCTLNPLSAKTLTITEGNLHATNDGAAGSATGTIAPTNGKWYFEITLSGSANFAAGVVNLDDWPSGTDVYNFGAAAAVLIESNANYNVTYGNTAASPSTLQTGTQLLNAKYGFAMDIDNNDLYVSANGNWYTGSAFDNTSFSSASAVTTDLPSNVPLTAFIRNPDTGSARCNFGNPAGADTISSGNADANGYGNFEYAVPSGYYSICTKNLAEFG